MTAPTYYEAQAGPAVPRPALPPGRHDAEVCIVGGGYAGLATALGLVERGVRDVVLLEAATIGHGASGRNGGFVFGGYSLDGAALVRALGREKARALYGLTRAAVALLRQRLARHRVDCDAVEGGALLVDWFGDDAALRRLQAQLQDDFGVGWRFVPRDEVAARHVRSRRYHAALFEPDAFHFQPLKAARGFARALDAAGVRVHEASPVCALAPHRVTTAAGAVVQARHVVVAGGGYLHGVLPAVERARLPIATYVVATEPLGERLAAVLPGRAATYDTRFAFDYYRALPDTRLLWGGRISVFDRSPAAVARLLAADLGRVFPSLAGARIEHAWSGLMSYARHKMPQIGRLGADGPWYALGFGGHGVAPTTVAGECLAAAIAEGRALPAGFAPWGLPRTWGAAGLAAAQASYWWAQARDALRAALR